MMSSGQFVITQNNISTNFECNKNLSGESNHPIERSVLAKRIRFWVKIPSVISVVQKWWWLGGPHHIAVVHHTTDHTRYPFVLSIQLQLRLQHFSTTASKSTCNPHNARFFNHNHRYCQCYYMLIILSISYYSLRFAPPLNYSVFSLSTILVSNCPPQSKFKYVCHITLSWPTSPSGPSCDSYSFSIAAL